MTAGATALEPTPDAAELRAARSHGMTYRAWIDAGRPRECPGNTSSIAQEPRSARGKGVGRPWAPYRSKLEARYADYLDILVVVGRVLEWTYEPETLDLGGARYTPDFAVAHADGAVTWDEVKGYSRRYDRMTLRIAASRHPDKSFRRVEWKRGGWQFTSIAPARAGGSETE